MPTRASEYLVGAVKDKAAKELLPTLSMHMEMQDAVLRNADNASMAAGPPTMKTTQPMTNNVEMPYQGKRKQAVWHPSIDGSGSELEKALPRMNRWKDLLPSSAIGWETESKAAYDVHTPAAATVPPGDTLVLDLELSATNPDKYALQFSSARIVDSGCRGSIKVKLFNSNPSAVKVGKDEE